MAKSSYNLSKRIFFTINWTDGTAYIGELKITNGEQKTLVTLTNKELKELTEVIRAESYDILGE